MGSAVVTRRRLAWEEGWLRGLATEAREPESETLNCATPVTALTERPMPTMTGTAAPVALRRRRSNERANRLPETA